MFKTVKLKDVDVPRGFNCRGEFTYESVGELVVSIKQLGLLYPPTVRPLPSGRYGLMIGFRRFAAIQILGWEELPVTVAEVDDERAAVLNFEENLARRDLNVQQEAQTLAKLYPEEQVTSRDAAVAVRKTQEWVLVRRALLKLAPEKQLLFASGRIPISRVREVLNSPDPDAAANALLKRKSVRSPMPGVKKRTKREVTQMIRTMMTSHVIGLPTRALAWVIGSVSTDDLLHDLNEYIRTGRLA